MYLALAFIWASLVGYRRLSLGQQTSCRGTTPHGYLVPVLPRCKNERFVLAFLNHGRGKIALHDEYTVRVLNRWHIRTETLARRVGDGSFRLSRPHFYYTPQGCMLAATAHKGGGLAQCGYGG